MFGVRDDLIVPLDGADPEALLEFWRWLIPDSLRPWFATALGDLFLFGAEDKVLWLDMGDGRLQVVASSENEFRKAVAIPDNNSFWFGAALVDELRRTGKVLAQGECYCYLQLPVLGGKYEAANFRVYDLVTHFRVWGPIHEKLRDIPDGTQIELVIN
jgi:hypothetical protein